MGVKSFMSEYTKHTELVSGVRPIYERITRDLRLAPGGQAELHLIAHKNGVEIAWLGSAEHGKGQGSAALAWLCDLADRHKVTLQLKIDGARIFTGYLRIMRRTTEQPALTPRALQAWYRSHGFKTVARKIGHESGYYDVYMRRAPQPENKSGQARDSSAARASRRKTVV